MYHHRKITYKRAADVCMKECLWGGLTCMILDVAFQRVTAVCMHYHIFIVDGGFKPACITLTYFAP